MANQIIPQRSEVPEEYTWNLKDLYESDQAWNEEYKALKALPEQITAFRGTLGRTAEDLLAWFRLQDQVEERLSRLYGYASCKGDEDTGNSFYQDMRGKAMSTLVTISSAAAFATPEIMEIPEDTLNLFYTAQPELETYRRSLYQIRRRKAHILSPAEEKLLASAGEMANASENVASVFRNADMVYPDVVDEAGNAHQLTDATFVPMLMSPDRELRRRAFETYYKALGQYKNTVAATLDGQFKQLCFFANARHYDSTIQASLDATEVPVPVYMNLIEAVHNNLDKMYRYVALRKKLLGVDGQGKNGTIGYIYGHKERACIETRNLSQPEELAPSDTKWSRRQLRKGCTECAENAYWWEQHYPGFEVVQVMIYDPGQLYEADRPRPDGWEATEAQAYLILRRRGFAKVRT